MSVQHNLLMPRESHLFRWKFLATLYFKVESKVFSCQNKLITHVQIAVRCHHVPQHLFIIRFFLCLFLPLLLFPLLSAHTLVFGISLFLELSFFKFFSSSCLSMVCLSVFVSVSLCHTLGFFSPSATLAWSHWFLSILPTIWC